MEKAQKDHFSQLMAKHKNNLKKSWNILKNAINKKKSKTQCTRFLIDGKLNTDKNDIANGFNNFFVNVGPSLADKIPSDNRSPSLFMKNRIPEDLIMSGVLHDEVIEIIKNMKEETVFQVSSQELSMSESFIIFTFQ